MLMLGIDAVTDYAKSETIVKNLLNGPSPDSFQFILAFCNSFLNYRKLVTSGIWTLIVGVDGKDVDHYTTTAAPTAEKDE